MVKPPKAPEVEGEGTDFDPRRRRLLKAAGAIAATAAAGGPAALAPGAQALAAGSGSVAAKLAATGVNAGNVLEFIASGSTSEANQGLRELAWYADTIRCSLDPQTLHISSLIQLTAGPCIEVEDLSAINRLSTSDELQLAQLIRYGELDAEALPNWRESDQFKQLLGDIEKAQRLLKEAGIDLNAAPTSDELVEAMERVVFEKVGPAVRAAFEANPEGVARQLAVTFKAWSKDSYLPKLQRMLGLSPDMGANATNAPEHSAEARKWMKWLEETFKQNEICLEWGKPAFTVVDRGYHPHASHQSFLIRPAAGKKIEDLKAGPLSAARLGISEEQMYWDKVESEDIVFVPMHSNAAHILSHISGSAKRRAQVIPAAQIAAETAELEARGKTLEQYR